MQLRQATSIAKRLIELLRPYCDKIEVAGSIRRKKPLVKDIEIVCIPKLHKKPIHDLFGEVISHKTTNTLFEFIKGDPRFNIALTSPYAVDNAGLNLQMRKKGMAFIKPGTSEIIPWEIKPDGKYWRGYIPSCNLKVDIFLCGRDNWGLIYLLRTGSAEFNMFLVEQLRRMKYVIRSGRLIQVSPRAVVHTPGEEDLFRAAGIQFVQAPDRDKVNVGSLRKRYGHDIQSG